MKIKSIIRSLLLTFGVFLIGFLFFSLSAKSALAANDTFTVSNYNLNTSTHAITFTASNPNPLFDDTDRIDIVVTSAPYDITDSAVLYRTNWPNNPNCTFGQPGDYNNTGYYCNSNVLSPVNPNQQGGVYICLYSEFQNNIYCSQAINSLDLFANVSQATMNISDYHLDTSTNQITFTASNPNPLFDLDRVDIFLTNTPMTSDPIAFNPTDALYSSYWPNNPNCQFGQPGNYNYTGYYCTNGGLNPTNNTPASNVYLCLYSEFDTRMYCSQAISYADLTVFPTPTPIPNQPPVITALTDVSVNKGDTYTANGSFTDSDSTSWVATVDYGDGSGIQPLTLSGMNFSLSHTYAIAGSYTVRVTIADDQNATDQTSTTVTVVVPSPTVLNVLADSYLNLYEQNQNEGGSPILRIENSAHYRTLVKFDESAIQAAIGNDPDYTAVLQLTITDNGNNWGTGRTIEADRLFQNWTEGNGYVNGNPTPNRGIGSGVTWNCPIDTNISNNTKDCSATWDMDNSANWPFAAPTATSLITNHQSGTVSFDVTADVQSFLNGTNQNYGWLLKKTDEGISGKIDFGSKENGNGPVLVITPQ